MLKLPTSLFECICFICVNIVSFSSLWGFRSPRLFITVFLNQMWSKSKTWVHFVPARSNEDCVSTLMYFSILFTSSLFSALWIVLSRVLFQHIFNIAVPRAEVKYTIWRWSSNPESLNCAFGLPYIKINSLCTHRTRPWSQKRASFICSSHTFGHVSGPLVSLACT